MITKEEYNKAQEDIKTYKNWILLCRKRIDEYLDMIISEKESIDTYQEAINNNKETICRYIAEQEVKMHFKKED